MINTVPFLSIWVFGYTISSDLQLITKVYVRIKYVSVIDIFSYTNIRLSRWVNKQPDSQTDWFTLK